MTIKLNNLRDVIAVAQTGSLRAAGRQIGIAQPAITRSIREIEHELGVTLFDRHAKGVRLTPMGEAFLRRAKGIQSELERAREEIEQLKGNFVGHVAIAISSASSIAVMGPALHTFRLRHPDALLKISESLFQPVETKVAIGELDFYVGPIDGSISQTNLVVEKLFENQRLVLTRKGHALAHARTLAELADAKWVKPSFTTRGSEADFDAMFERAGLPQPKIVMHTQSALITMLAVANSDLLTILPRQFLEFSATADQLQAVALADPLYAAPICIVRRSLLPLTPIAEYLCDLIRKGGHNYGLKHAAGGPVTC